MSHYVPDEHTSVETTEQIVEYLRRELRAISRSLSETTELELRPRFVEPERPRAGMIVYADGTSWNPGGTGEGVYVRTIAGAWVKL